MRFRKLRIAFSITCGVACVLMSVLWVRSYRVCDGVGWSSIEAPSGLGVIQFSALAEPQHRGWYSTSLQANDVSSDENTDIRAFVYHVDQDLVYLNAPHWFLAVASAAFAVLPWLRWRFSLCILLIATTLVAVILRLIVWVVR
jgi:hypothetical protein